MHMCCTPYYVCVCNSSTFRRGAKQHSCSLLFCNDDCFTPSCNTVSIMLLLCTLQEAEVCSERYSVSDYTIVSSDGSISVSINASADVNNYMVTMNSANAANISRGLPTTSVLLHALTSVTLHVIAVAVKNQPSSVENQRPLKSVSKLLLIVNTL